MASENTFGQVLRRIGLEEVEAEKFDKVRLPFELRPNQVENIHCGLSWDRFGLFDEPRCGKTISMQLLTVYFAKYGLRSIVLMPPILFDQYKSTMEDIKGHGCSVVTFDYSPAKREEHLVAWQSGQGDPPDVLLMSKEIFRKHHTQFTGAQYKALLFDECHRGLMSETLAPVPRNSGVKKKRKVTSTYYDCVRRFMEEPETRLVLSTGSPLPNDLYQAYPIISLKSPRAYRSRMEFDNLHVTWSQLTIRTRFGAKQVAVPDPKRFKEINLLHRQLYHQARRVLKLEVLGLDVPNVQIVPIHLSTGHYKIYKDLLTQRMLEMEGGEVIDARQDSMLRNLAMRLIVNPEISGKKVTDNAVLQAINALCDTADLSKTKVVLFAYFNDSVEYLVKALEKHNPAMVYGPNGSEKNRAQAAKFINDESCRLLVASPGSGGVGLTLGGVSQTVIVVEPITTPGAFDQAVSRVILGGQTEPVSVYILKVLKTLSPRGLELMLGKNGRVQEVMLDRKTVLSQLLGG